MLKQKDGVYNAITSVFEDAGIHFEDGMNASEFMTKEIRASIQSIVAEGFKSGSISFEDTPSNHEKLSSPSKLNTYVSGVVSNWLRKDTRLNGNTKYTAKNPGSRVGASDPQLKALRQLANQFKTDSVKMTAIQSQIDARVSALQAEKAKKITVDLSALPAELVASLGLSK